MGCVKTISRLARRRGGKSDLSESFFPKLLQYGIVVKRKTKLFLVAILCVMVGYSSWPVSALQVRAGSEGSTLVLVQPIADREKVVIGFVHSLYRVVQEESYIHVDGHLRLVEVFFGSFDALNYYDPLEVYPREAMGDGYKIAINPPFDLEVNFAMGHSTEFWIQIGQSPVVKLDRIMSREDFFSLKMISWPRLMARFMEIKYG